MLNKKNIIQFFSILIILISFFVIMYTFQYNVVFGHVCYIGYGRSFFSPEHGRYLATFLCSLFEEYIPFALNLHPNTVIRYMVNPFLALISVLFFVVLTNMFFIFGKKENNILKPELSNPCFSILYALLFSVIFNHNKVFTTGTEFMQTRESSSFFEYTCSAVIFFLLMSMLSYYIFKQKTPGKKNLIIMSCLTFFTGITLEVINIPLLIAFILFFIFNTNNPDKTVSGFMKVIYRVFIIAFICYFINSTDDGIICKYETYKEYLINDFPEFVRLYFSRFCLNLSYYTIPLLILNSLIIIKKRSVIYPAFVSSILIGIYVFYFGSFLLGYTWEDTFFFEWGKFVYTYRLICICLIITCAGFLIDCDIKTKNKTLAKIILCIISALFLYKPAICELPVKIYYYRDLMRTKMWQNYYIEKTAMQHIEGNEIICPMRFLTGKDEISFEELSQSKWDCDSLLFFIKIIHYPDLQEKTELIFSNDYNSDVDLYMETTENIPDFNSLLKHKMKKNNNYKNDGSTSPV